MYLFFLAPQNGADLNSLKKIFFTNAKGLHIRPDCGFVKSNCVFCKLFKNYCIIDFIT